MNRLDERLKERARREDCPIPQGFDGRMDAILEGLPEGRKKPGPRRLRRWAVAGVLAAALCVGGVAAASGALELIARPGGFGGTAEGFQPYSAEGGVGHRPGLHPHPGRHRCGRGVYYPLRHHHRRRADPQG